jgi:putative phage-type endonuclease
MDNELEQGSPEWYRARAGSLGSSQLAAALSRSTDGLGRGTTAKNLAVQLAIERVTGEPTETFMSYDMRIGKERESAARELYGFLIDEEVSLIGIARHPHIKWTHSSPDGLVGDNGCVEFKCPKQRTHFDTIAKDQKVKRAYALQVQWHMACTGRQWCDYVSFNPTFPSHLRIYRDRMYRNDEYIEELEGQIRDFLYIVDDNEHKLRNMRAKW